MPTAIDQALITLVPSLNHLPIELTSLASALATQSRSKAGNLKPDEEIARNYVCAHIACEKLKSRLGLELIQPKPPVAPRVYKKLKTFFDKLLEVPSTPSTNRKTDAINRSGGASAKNVTPTSAARGGVTPISRKRMRQAQDETIDTAPAGVTLPDVDLLDADTPSRRSEKRARPLPPSITESGNPLTTSLRKQQPGTLFADSATTQEFPEFVDTMIARLVNRFKSTTAASHIRAGLRHVVSARGYTDAETSTNPPTKISKGSRKLESSEKHGDGLGSITASRIPALLVVLTLFVLSKQGRLDLTVKANFLEKQKAAIGAVREMEEGWAPDEDTLIKDLKSYFRCAGEERWLAAPWFRDITADTGEPDEVAMDVGEMVPPKENKPSKTPLRRKEKHAKRPGDEEEEEDEGPAGLQVGLGTMFQDAIDWLSEDRRQEYGVFKMEIMQRLNKLERPSDMEKAVGRRGGRTMASAA
ncbi:hypothetical protein CAC42_6202 [Sphaceloma murrayae]|uniref:ORC6 first cyclin-like domain-containing protein n=1 Tax=Sphaceloma murrayae TaxID=2082308 RepID=A0A2K1QTK7_9PEZI|nr:hypothetical protein CAC42_6202 [Sphaceloma murrayae]